MFRFHQMPNLNLHSGSGSAVWLNQTSNTRFRFGFEHCPKCSEPDHGQSSCQCHSTQFSRSQNQSHDRFGMFSWKPAHIGPLVRCSYSFHFFTTNFIYVLHIYCQTTHAGTATQQRSCKIAYRESMPICQWVYARLGTWLFFWLVLYT